MEELEASLGAYEGQLAQVEGALQSDPSNTELKQLKEDLSQVIMLTTQSLLEAKKAALLDQLNNAGEVDEASKSTPEERAEEAPTVSESESHDETVKKLLGMKCRAPHRTRGCGTLSLSNAVVFDVEGASADDDSLLVRVVFSHPLSRDMAPCPFYMDGRCRFDDAECKYSHGETVKLADLAEFREPDFASLEKGSPVLAKEQQGSSASSKASQSGPQLWRRATVVEICHVEDVVLVQFGQSLKDSVKLPLESVFPLEANDSVDVTSEDSSGMPLAGEGDEDRGEELFVPVDVLGNLSDAALGEWEKHTRGVGSRLMAKMGYVTGGGLGKGGSGRVLPVPAMVYPTGKSLDWCMEVREKAGGGDVLSVERKLSRQREKEERKSVKRVEEQEARDKRENSLFNFINKSLAVSGPAKKLPAAARPLEQPRAGPSKARVGNNSGGGSSASLNLKSMRVGDEIRSLEREISRLESSHARHAGKDSVAAAAITKKIVQKRGELRALKQAEDKLQAKKNLETDNKKLCIF